MFEAVTGDSSTAQHVLDAVANSATESVANLRRVMEQILEGRYIVDQ